MLIVDRLGEQGEVVAQVGVEELHILADHPHPSPKFTRGDVGQRHPADHHAADIRVVQPGEQTSDRRLPTARPAQNPENDPLPDLEGHLLERGAAPGVLVVVAKGDPVEADGERTSRQVIGPRVDHLGRDREQLLHPGDPGTCFLQVLHLVANPLHGQPEQFHVGEHQVDRPDGEVTGAEQPLPQPVDQRCTEGEDEDVGRPQRRPSPPGAHLVGEPATEYLDEAAHEERRGSVGPHLLGATQDLPDEAEELGTARPHPGPPWDGEVVHPEHRHHRYGGEHDHHEPDPDALEDEKHQDPDEEHQVADDVDGEL